MTVHGINKAIVLRFVLTQPSHQILGGCIEEVKAEHRSVCRLEHVLLPFFVGNIFWPLHTLVQILLRSILRRSAETGEVKQVDILFLLEKLNGILEVLS